MNLFADVVSDGLFDNLRADGLPTLVRGLALIVVAGALGLAAYFAVGRLLKSRNDGELTASRIVLVFALSIGISYVIAFAFAYFPMNQMGLIPEQTYSETREYLPPELAYSLSSLSFRVSFHAAAIILGLLVGLFLLFRRGKSGFGGKFRSGFDKAANGFGIALLLIVSLVALPAVGLNCARSGNWFGAVASFAPGLALVLWTRTIIRAQGQYIKALEELALASEQLLEQTRELARESGSSAEPGIDAPSTPVGSALDVPVVNLDIPSNIDLFERALDESNDFDSLRYRTARANLDKMQKMRRERFERQFAENEELKDRYPDQLLAVQAIELADVVNDRRRDLFYSPIEVCVISSDETLGEGLQKFARYFKRRTSAELTFVLPFENAELIKTKLVGIPVSVFIVKR